LFFTPDSSPFSKQKKENETMMSYRGRTLGWVVIGVVLLGACTSTPKSVTQPTLNAPLNANPTAIAAVNEGNQLFASGQWQPAKAQYEKALRAQDTVAEAHYNLALTLDRMGMRKEARTHYMEAANLAPGHQVIWNSPVLRRYGDVAVEKSNAAAPALPSIGGANPGSLGSGGRGGGGGVF